MVIELGKRIDLKTEYFNKELEDIQRPNQK